MVGRSKVQLIYLVFQKVQPLSCKGAELLPRQLCPAPAVYYPGASLAWHLLSLLLVLEIWSKTVQSDNCKGHLTTLSDEIIFFIETDIKTFFETESETFLDQNFQDQE